MQRPFICHKPRVNCSPVIFSSPHSGRQYSKKFLSQAVLGFDEMRLSEDFYVESLLEPVVEFGSVLLEACFPRSFVDVNRSPTDLDQKLIKHLDKSSTNPRTLAGLGVIPRIVGNGHEIYKSKIGLNEVSDRLNKYYFPFHQRLKQIIGTNINNFGFAILFDFHSMPHSCIDNFNTKKSLIPQVILGDCFGTSCDSRLSEKVFDIFSIAGFKVEMNRPFSGGFITKNYGVPKENVQVIQIEIDRSLYMNEKECTLHSGYSELKKKLYSVTYELSQLHDYKDGLFRAAE